MSVDPCESDRISHMMQALQSLSRLTRLGLCNLEQLEDIATITAECSSLLRLQLSGTYPLWPALRQAVLNVAGTLTELDIVCCGRIETWPVAEFQALNPE